MDRRYSGETQVIPMHPNLWPLTNSKIASTFAAASAESVRFGDISGKMPHAADPSKNKCRCERRRSVSQVIQRG
jgi:hypothetical protein